MGDRVPVGGRVVTEVISGWGSTARVTARVVEPTDEAGVIESLRQAERGVIGRGMGRSYGDAAQRAGGTVVSALGIRSPIALDESTGTVTAGSGFTLRELTDHLVPRGWFLPVVPGTADVSLGGAIAADVHGKNHHRSGSLGAHVRSLDLATPDGVVRRLSPDDDTSAAFRGTVGGMGLTGIITAATLQLRSVRGDKLAVRSHRTQDLDTTMAVLTEADDRHEYTVAWLDLSNPRRTGRGIVDAADHIDAGDAVEPFPHQARLAVPPLPANVIRPTVTRTFNSMWWRRGPSRPRDSVVRFRPYFHPLDAVAQWRNLYGPVGFTQWQMCVPVAADEAVRRCAEALASHAVPPSLVVLKRFGDADPAPLSFPVPGWTLAVDVPAGDPSTAVLLDTLDHLVAEAGGRIYLAKDARLRSELVPIMYPQLPKWQAVREALDPGDRMVSDLSMRLGLHRTRSGPHR